MLKSRITRRRLLEQSALATAALIAAPYVRGAHAAVVTAVASAVDYYRRFSHVLTKVSPDVRVKVERAETSLSSPYSSESPRHASALPPDTRSSRIP